MLLVLQSPKALTVLGVQKSEQKLGDRLGLRAEQVRAHTAAELTRRMERDRRVQQQRELTAAALHSHKACGVLGVDLSAEKVKRLLHIDERQLEAQRADARQCNVELQLSPRSPRSVRGVRAPAKAQALLGLDQPSHAKMCDLLGATVQQRHNLWRTAHTPCQHEELRAAHSNAACSHRHVCCTF